MDIQKIEMHLLILMLIKSGNPACIALTKASVDLQHIEIPCLTDASIKWLHKVQESIVPARTICMKLGQGLSSADPLEK